MDNLLDKDGQKIEEMLTPLIQKHGLEAVTQMLDKLWMEKKAKWEDIQRLWNISKNIDNRLKRLQRKQQRYSKAAASIS